MHVCIDVKYEYIYYMCVCMHRFAQFDEIPFILLVFFSLWGNVLT